EAISHANPTRVSITPVPIVLIAARGFRRKLPGFFLGLLPARKRHQRTNFLDRADADPISFAQGAIDGSRLSDAQLRPMHELRYVGRVGISVPSESFTLGGLINRSAKYVTTLRGITKFFSGNRAYCETSPCSRNV